jgi:phasin family protein
MSTSIPRAARKTASKSARKSAVAARPAGKRSAAAAAAVRRKALPKAGDASDERSLRELAARLSKIELSGLAGWLVKGWREDLDAVAKAARSSYAGLQQVVERQAGMIKEAAAEWRTASAVMREIGPKRTVRHLDKLAMASLELALADVRELAALAARSQRDAYDIVTKRVNRNLDAVQRLLRK